MSSTDCPSQPKSLGRRRFLQVGGAVGAASALDLTGLFRLAPAGAQVAASPSAWSNPATWGGAVPGTGSVAVVSKPILLDVNTTVAGVVINPGGELIFDSAKSVALNSSGNVVVQGRLTMRPSRVDILHRLSFINVKESSFVGGGEVVLSTDVGLWVMGAGVLDVAGSPKLGWSRAAGTVAKGATSVAILDDPSGWQIGDEVVITPTGSPATPNHSLAFDTLIITGISGRTITLSGPTAFDHPAVTVKPGVILTAEVLNLSRNVRIEGAATGRSHIFVKSTSPQRVDHAGIRHVGPRRPSGGYTAFVLGRYGIHFHMSSDGSRGTSVQGTVIRDAGSHAFVTHEATGVSFRDCISHNTMEDAYWWDLPANTRAAAPVTNDLLYDRCVASRVTCDPPFRGYNLAGFMLGAGTGNTARNCVAVGVQGNSTANGFVWPEGSEGSWVFQDCVAHNNKVHGIYAWQNTAMTHVVTRFTGYHNGKSGISHGAYNNRYRYEDCVLYGNAESAILLHAGSATAVSPLTFVGAWCDGAGLSAYCVKTWRHSLAPAGPTQLVNCSFRGSKKAAVGLAYDGLNGSTEADLVDLIECTFVGNELWLVSTIHPGSTVRVQDSVRGVQKVQRTDQSGTLRATWNARVTPIPSFVPLT